MKPLILFDMDGTLITIDNKMRHVNTNDVKSPKEQMKKIAIQHGVPPNIVIPLNRMAHIWNQTIRYLEEKGYSDDEINIVISELDKQFMVEEKADHAVSVLLPNTLATLETLSSLGYEMGIVTTASRESYNHISRSPDYGNFGIYFKYSVTRSECRYVKPDPEPINKIIVPLSLDTFIFVGDTEHDARATQSAGGKFILINTRKHNDEIKFSMNPVAVIETIIELPDILQFTQI
jgi:phosphoglycolate phosphatase-like HAD superfamily hydrolase